VSALSQNIYDKGEMCMPAGPEKYPISTVMSDLLDQMRYKMSSDCGPFRDINMEKEPTAKFTVRKSNRIQQT